MSREEPVAKQIVALAHRMGTPAFVAACVDLMSGADRMQYVEELRALTGHAWEPGDSVFDSSSWADYWLRTWGARGLLHVWDDSASDAIVKGLRDEHWRPAEMCLKVVARHEVAEAGEEVAALLDHAMPRVRVQALRAMAIVGDTEHRAAVERLLNDDQIEVRRQAHLTLELLVSRLG